MRPQEVQESRDKREEIMNRVGGPNRGRYGIEKERREKMAASRTQRFNPDDRREYRRDVREERN